MDSLVLTAPTEEYLEQIAQFRQEFLAAGESIHGSCGLEEYEDAADWIGHCRGGLRPGNAEYLCIRQTDNRLVGVISIRRSMEPDKLYLYGHIGYSIRRTERKKGYGTQQLRLALDRCRQWDMERVMISCDKDNPASSNVILKNGGKLENEVIDPEDGALMQRYWIEL